MFYRLKIKFGKIVYLMRKSFYFAWNRHHFLIPPKAFIKYAKSFIKVLKRNGNSTSNLFYDQKAYTRWITKNESEVKLKKFDYEPLLSIIIPVYNISSDYLRECLDSCLNQTYRNFEICIADDCSTDPVIKTVLEEYKDKDSRIKVIYRNKNGMISLCLNSAIKIANGDFVLFVDADDVISKNALYYMVKVLNKDSSLDLVYSDEDKIDIKGKRCEPHFKPDWSPDTFLGINYICHLTMIRRSLVNEVGGFRSVYDGSQDYDLFLRIVDRTNKIFHIPKILYHWRQSANSTSMYLDSKSYIKEAGLKAIEDSLRRRGKKAKVIYNPNFSGYLVEYGNTNPLISIILLTKDHGDMLNVCLDGIYNKTNYRNFEVILVDNGSTENRTREVIKLYSSKYDNFKVLRLDVEFNYSYLNNEAVKLASGEYLLLLNDDTKVIDDNWLDKMIGYAELEHVGAVGIKLLYSDRKVQHAGVAIGYGGVAGHVYVTASENEAGDFGRLVMPYNYSCVTAACLLVNKRKYLEVNGLDEKLSVAYNDVDFCLKLLKLGYFNVMLSNVKMFHYESKTRGYEDTPSKYNRFLKEQEYMKNKWQGELERDRFFSNNYY